VRIPLLVTVAAALCVGSASLPARQPDGAPPIDELVAALQIHWNQVADLTADFEQSYTGGVLSTSSVERGTVAIRKPGLMRWDYTDPEEKLYISDGTTLYSYYPLDQQVITAALPPDDLTSTPALFLAGRGDLQRDFSVDYDRVTPALPDTWMVRLTPNRAASDYDWLTLAVEHDSLRFRQLIATDSQGGVSTFTFSNLMENQGLSDSLFVFQIPPDTDVITEDAFIR
jgi:outer membrane lipoprotein carrier protein